MEEGDSRFMEQEAIKTCEIRAESFLKTKLPSDFFIMKFQLRQTKTRSVRGIFFVFLSVFLAVF